MLTYATSLPNNLIKEVGYGTYWGQSNTHSKLYTFIAVNAYIIPTYKSKYNLFCILQSVIIIIKSTKKYKDKYCAINLDMTIFCIKRETFTISQ